MNSKVRIKLKGLEVDFEGSEEYLRNDLLSLIEKLLVCFPKESVIEEVEQEMIIPDAKPDEQKKKVFEMSPNTIASLLSVKTGPQLAIAASAYLTFGKGLEKFKRNDLLDAMKLATSYNKQTYINNLSGTLTRLVKTSKLIETQKDTYTLAAQIRKELEQALGV